MLNKTQRYLAAVIVLVSLILGAAPLCAAENVPRLEEIDLASFLRAQQLEAARAREIKPVLPQVATTLSRGAIHTVKKGDTLWNLAKHYGVSITALQQWNGLRGNLIKVGQTLQVSAGAQPLASRSGSSNSYLLLWPVTGTVTSGWGYRTRFEKFHYGLDIAAPTGTPIRAASAGVVEFAGWRNGYGYCVFLNHGNGLKTAYGHASKLYVQRGQSVISGEKIAAVGSTGFSTGPHVHLEVRINDRLVDPATVLPKYR